MWIQRPPPSRRASFGALRRPAAPRGGNLSVLLYNADAAELPLATVRELANLQTRMDFQCNVSVRHSDPAKLRRVYAELVNKAGDDPDLPVVSETSDNFISKLRIAVTPSIGDARECERARLQGLSTWPSLHDVVSRTAGEEWIARSTGPTSGRSLEHAPSRWSYRSVSGENELKSTTFLTCPRQTASGWAYVGAVAAVVEAGRCPRGERFCRPAASLCKARASRLTMNDAHATGRVGRHLRRAAGQAPASAQQASPWCAIAGLPPMAAT
jgi:S-DNA-T family DNA segregation ATPase FtsK/SpoIIIE